MKSRFYLTSLATAAALALTAAPAAAQFTTFVPPPRPAAVDTVPQQAAVARTDSAQAQTLTDMKVWVDSAARALAVNVTPTTADSAFVDTPASDVDTQAVRGTPTTSFSEGAPAPDTATMLPMLALAALGCIGAGMVLLRRGGA